VNLRDGTVVCDPVGITAMGVAAAKFTTER